LEMPLQINRTLGNKQANRFTIIRHNPNFMGSFDLQEL
jgi:hypothetical protein